MRRFVLFACLVVSCSVLQAQQTSPAWSRVQHLQHGINASEWFAQSRDYSPQRLRSYTTLDDIERMHSMGFDHIRLSIDPAIFDCRRFGANVSVYRLWTRSSRRLSRKTWPSSSTCIPVTSTKSNWASVTTQSRSSPFSGPVSPSITPGATPTGSSSRS